METSSERRAAADRLAQTLIDDGITGGDLAEWTDDRFQDCARQHGIDLVKPGWWHAFRRLVSAKLWLHEANQRLGRERSLK